PRIDREGAVLPAGFRRSEDLREADLALFAAERIGRARYTADARAVLGALPPEGAGELESVLEDARVRRREPEGHRSESEVDAGIQGCGRRRRRHDRSVDTVRVQDPVEGLQLRS